LPKLRSYGRLRLNRSSAKSPKNHSNHERNRSYGGEDDSRPRVAHWCEYLARLIQNLRDRAGDVEDEQIAEVRDRQAYRGFLAAQ
jgi:hypothetical protein